MHELIDLTLGKAKKAHCPLTKSPTKLPTKLPTTKLATSTPTQAPTPTPTKVDCCARCSQSMAQANPNSNENRGCCKTATVPYNTTPYTPLTVFLYCPGLFLLHRRKL